MEEVRLENLLKKLEVLQTLELHVGIDPRIQDQQVQLAINLKGLLNQEPISSSKLQVKETKETSKT